MNKKYKIIFFGLLLLRFVFSFLVWHPDVNNHVDWGKRFWDYGPKQFYTANVWNFTWPNQPPGTIYIYAGIKKVYDFVYSIFWWMNVNIPLFPSNLIFYLEEHMFPAFLKLPSIAADFGIAYLIYKSIADKKLGIAGAMLWLVNPVIWYNSSIWGQTDSIVSFFVFLSLYLLQKNKPILSVTSIAISFYIKASLLIFIPVYILFFIMKKYSIVTYLKSFIFAISVIFLLTLPFAKGNPLIWLFELFQGKIFVQQLQVITANAFNIWATIATIHERPQTQMLGPLSYQIWAIILFTSSYIALVWMYLRSKTKDWYWLLSMIAFSSFMLMTNMHERYLYPLFPFFTVIAIQNKKLMKYYVIVTLISLLNLYNFWWYPRIPIIINFLSFSDRLMPRILGFLMFVIYLILFKELLRQTKPSRI